MSDSILGESAGWQLEDIMRFGDMASIAVTGALLFARLADDYLGLWLFGNVLPGWYPYLFAGIVWVLVSVLLWLNRSRLGDLNVDKPFVLLMGLSGGLLFTSLPQTAGLTAALLVGLATCFVWWMYLTGRVQAEPLKHIDRKSLVLVAISLLPPIPILVLALLGRGLVHPISLRGISAAAFSTDLSGIVFEELLFRGALWHYLKKLHMGDTGVVFTQAILFWLAHHAFLSTGASYSFWVSVPFIAVLFGVLVWRTKSLTLSTTSHFLYNVSINVAKYLV